MADRVSVREISAEEGRSCRGSCDRIETEFTALRYFHPRRH